MPSSSPNPSNASAPDSRSERRAERLNWLGHVVQAGGVVHRWSRQATHVIQARTTAVARRSRQAFYDGLNPNIDDAVVVDEYDTDAP